MNNVPSVVVFFKFSSIQYCLYFAVWIMYDFVTGSLMCVSFVQEDGLGFWGSATKDCFCNVCITVCENFGLKSSLLCCFPFNKILHFSVAFDSNLIDTNNCHVFIKIL